MIEIYTDGACEPNPGLMGAGYVIIDGSETIKEHGEILGDGTCNIAEFMAVIMALQSALELGLKNEEIILHSDSKLIVNMITKGWKGKLPHMIELSQQARELAREFSDLTIEWISGDMNWHADTLSRAGTLKPKRFK